MSADDQVGDELCMARITGETRLPPVPQTSLPVILRDRDM